MKWTKAHLHSRMNEHLTNWEAERARKAQRKGGVPYDLARRRVYSEPRSNCLVTSQAYRDNYDKIFRK